MWRTSTSDRVRNEEPGDEAAIAALIALAFAGAPHGDGSESGIVARLRTAGDLALSLVAVENDRLVGHAAFSPVSIDARHLGWFGLGPVSVHPDRQGAGIGSALIRHGLGRLRSMRASGCVVLGDPAFYGRFGFAADAQLRYIGAPAEYFQRVLFTGTLPKGAVAYAPAFAA